MTEDAQVLAKAAKIRLLISDVDGVMTDGKLYYGERGEALKVFSVKDGLGIKLLQSQGIEFAVLSGRQSVFVKQRCQELGIRHVYQGHEHKVAVYQQLLAELKLEPEQVAYIGDDWPDLALIQLSGLGVAVADASPWLKQHADWTTHLAGGQGAVREVCELILHAQSRLSECQQHYLALSC